MQPITAAARAGNAAQTTGDKHKERQRYGNNQIQFRQIKGQTEGAEDVSEEGRWEAKKKSLECVCVCVCSFEWRIQSGQGSVVGDLTSS